MEHQHHEHHQHVALAVFATAAVTAIIVGALVYNFQQKKFDEKQAQVTKQLELAGNVVKDLQEDKKVAEEKIKETADALKEVSKEKSTATERIKLPIIRYQRPGLLTAQDKAELEKKLIGPYSTYFNLQESSDVLVTMMITVPEQKGDEYSVDAIHETTTVGFLFGKRGETLDYWKPECMGPCTDYPKQFREKYPELVEKQ